MCMYQRISDKTENPKILFFFGLLVFVFYFTLFLVLVFFFFWGGGIELFSFFLWFVCFGEFVLFVVFGFVCVQGFVLNFYFLRLCIFVHKSNWKILKIYFLTWFVFGDIFVFVRLFAFGGGCLFCIAIGLTSGYSINYCYPKSFIIVVSHQITSKVDDRSWRRPEGSLFNSYCTVV